MYSPQDLEPDSEGGRFGHIKGTKVGQIWSSRCALCFFFFRNFVFSQMCRSALSESGVHVPRTAGISGGVASGAASVVLSGAYADDVDCGETV